MFKYLVRCYRTSFIKKSCLASVLCALCFSAAAAFDPTVMVAGAQAMNGVMGGLEKADEMTDLGFALEDLLSELGIDSQGEDEMKRSIRKLEDLSSKAKELQWNKEELRSMLDHDLQQANGLTGKLKAIRNMISASKRIAAVMGVRPKAGEKAIRIQEVRINSMILEELQNIRRAQFLSYLENREAKASREIFMQEIIEKEKVQLDAKALDRKRGNI